MANEQQTVLRVQFDNVNTNTGITEYEFLDLYGDVPIKINKSFAELQDISKRNSDYSIGLTLPGSKKNNKFFENFFNVDTQSLYFNATKRVNCQVLLNDQAYFTGYLKLNKTSVLNSKVEYDVTLYSTIGDLYGQIGNNLLIDLNYSDTEYNFNHTFDQYAVTNDFNRNLFSENSIYPNTYFYPIIHNGYEYSGDTVNLSGGTPSKQTRLYTTSGTTLGSYATAAAAYAVVGEYRINSPYQGLIDNQLKPGLSIWSLIQLIFKTYNYTIKSDFFNTPWFKALYMYGYFSSDSTKFGYSIGTIATLPLEGVELVPFEFPSGTINVIVCKLGTGIPCYCSNDITFTLTTEYPYEPIQYESTHTITAGSTGYTADLVGDIFIGITSDQVAIGTTLRYFPQAANTIVPYVDGDLVDFSKVISQDLKQIDLISSIAKKFNLVFIPDPEKSNQIIIEPYNYYIGTGDIHNWSDKISFDKGFTVEPALNYIESELFLTDQEDGDYGNKTFKDSNARIYGQNLVYNPTAYKSQQKKIDTIFSPEFIRTWDQNIALPLGINYVGTSQANNTAGGSENQTWTYKGVRTKPKLMYWLGGFNPFLNIVGETFSLADTYQTFCVYISTSDLSGVAGKFQYIPVISHTMPIGNPDSNKKNNDSICNLFNSEPPAIVGTTSSYNVYTENDAYKLFYQNRVDNLYNANTRFLTGNFYLKLSDIQNLKPNDLIKINEQYFTWNKIEGFNLTNTELTKVELIQANNNPSTYPTRYFEYYYCDDPTKIYKFKTDFTNENLRDTNYFWSILYDYNVGILGGNVSGFTASFADNQANAIKYVPYFMYEVSDTTYDTTGIDWQYDSLHNYIYTIGFDPFNTYVPGFWINSGSTTTGLNLYSNCSGFTSAATTYGIVTGSSTYHGVIATPTPTPTATVAPTPTPTPDMLGSLLMSYDSLELGDNYQVSVNGALRTLQYIDSSNLYSTYIYPGDVVRITGSTISPYGKIWSVNRVDYTTDDQGGDMGIRTTGATFTTTIVDIYNTIIEFTATPIAQDYNFEYLVGLISGPTATPTPTPTPTSTPTPTPTSTPTPTPTSSPTPTPSSTATPTPTTSPTPTPTPTPILTYMSIGGGFSGSTNPILAGISFDSEILSSGKIIIGHRYTSYSGTSVSTVTRLLNDGTLDTTFITSGVTSTESTYDIKEQSDGKLVISGLEIGGFNLYRLNSDGSTDTGFTPTLIYGGTSFNEERIELQSDNKIIYGNDFSTAYSGYTGLMRFNSNGTLDTTFNSGGSQFSGSYSDRVYDIYVYPDDKILVGGLFNKYNGVTCNGLIKLNSNGTVDTSFNVDTTTGYTFPPMIYDIEVQSDGKILVGLGDTTFNKKYWNITVGLMWRLNADGTFDSSFPYNQFLPNSGGNGGINDIYQMTDGSLLVGGTFTSYSGTSVNNLVKLNSDGTLNTTFTPPAINGSISDIEITTDGGVLCTGTMTLLGAQTARGIIKLNPINGSSLIT